MAGHLQCKKDKIYSSSGSKRRLKMSSSRAIDFKRRKSEVEISRCFNEKRAKIRVVFDESKPISANLDDDREEHRKIGAAFDESKPSSTNPDDEEHSIIGRVFNESKPSSTNDLDDEEHSKAVRGPLTKEELLAWLDEGADEELYLKAAFRSVCSNEVFMFLEHDYFVINIDPESPKKNRIVKGPLMFCDGFPLLFSSDFNDYGVDAAFGCHGVNEAFLFSGAECVKIRYDVDTRMGHPVKGGGPGQYWPHPTRALFPFLKGDDVCVDAAFESTVIGEAYLFRRSRYIRFNYKKRKLIARGLITDAFPCLRGTVFSSDVGAAFASHKPNEVYLFKDNRYVIVHYNPSQTSDSYIIVGPEEIVPNNWPSLRGIVPYNNDGRGDIEPQTWTPYCCDGECVGYPDRGRVKKFYSQS